MKKLYLALFISILWTGTNFAAEEINGIMYNLDATTRTATVAKIVQYNQYYYSGAIVIPEQVSYNNRDYTVIGIDEQAFYQQQNLTSVVIPATVTSIGSSAFEGCSSLNSVTIAEGCEVINTKAFNRCSALAKINIPSSVKRIEEQAFADCSNLAEITLNEGLTYIGGRAFYGLQKLKSITIPSTMEDMGRASFYNCTGLAKIVWKPVHCSDFTSAINAPFSSYYVGSYSSGHTEERNNWTTQITFGDEVEHIPAYLCYNFQGELRNLVIPDNVKSIGECAFAGCDKLVSMKLGAGLTEIGKNAFSDCTTLTQVSIPDNVTTINPSAFYGCTNLTTLTFGKGIQTLGTNAFGNGGKLTTINIYA
nr:leucine-rich repeat domain-containing protein [Paludibacteraceae bacterium]